MITPLDIENKKFSKQMVNGYNVDEVDEFLDELTTDYERLYKENKELKDNTEELHNDVGQYKNIESTLQNTLIIAQRTADEIQAVAKQQAEQIIKDAEYQAKTKLDEINTQIVLKEKEIDELKKQFSVYKAKMESLLISQLELIKDMSDDEQ
jgi:cell division initiation protein